MHHVQDLNGHGFGFVCYTIYWRRRNTETRNKPQGCTNAWLNAAKEDRQMLFGGTVM